MKVRLVFLLFIFVSCSVGYGEEIDGKAYLKKGKFELESRNYEDAISSLTAAEKDFPLLGDYALFWLSDAYHETGNHAESLKTIRTLLHKYSQSPLRKKARIHEIKEAEEVSEENIQQLFTSYIKDYPDDTEIKYIYAQWLKKQGNTDRAKSFFKEIYMGAGPLSELVFNELDSSDISAEDLIERASNLMKVMDFKRAESTLRSALSKDNGKKRNEILKSIGYCLFRQKRYREAAEIYEKAHEKYWKVRSLYRAGEKDAFDSALSELLTTGDKRAGRILVTVAADLRRDGKTKEAIREYQGLMALYPSETETALWGIGWTYFLTGEYKKAADVFTKLYNSSNDTRYLYWKARSLEEAGGDSLALYSTLMKKNCDFYSIMSYVKTRESLELSNTNEIKQSLGPTNTTRTTPSSLKKSERVEALFDLGLLREALSELIYLSRDHNSIEDILYIGSKFQELDEYKNMVNLAKKLPYTERLHHLLYPLAYWDSIEGLSKKYNIDPLLVLSVAREESRFDTKVRSPAGALGLMQLMPRTAYRISSKLKLRVHNTQQVYDVKNNLHIGIYYLSSLINEFGSYSYALAAYNAGEEAVRKWIQKGNYKSIDEFIEDIPYNETKNYVKRVITTFFEYKRAFQ
ncbi:MAG: transglycosylase SLT domain-containing protein [Nitrospirota bacterium]|nr:transglycosylase SLT domain-containing protein [Nitrospirota bacterium]